MSIIVNPPIVYEKQLGEREEDSTKTHELLPAIANLLPIHWSAFGKSTVRFQATKGQLSLSKVRFLAFRKLKKRQQNNKLPLCVCGLEVFRSGFFGNNNLQNHPISDKFREIGC